jgi:hypothetical protein
MAFAERPEGGGVGSSAGDFEPEEQGPEPDQAET